MKYDACEGWSAHCASGHGCRVLPCPPPDHGIYGSELREREFPRRSVNGTESSSILKLRNGSGFVFVWPFYGLRMDCDGYGFPAQELRFTIVECQKDEFPEAHHLRPDRRHLLSLPKEALAKIASYLDPKEFLTTLGVVGRVFTSPAMEGRIPWRELKLDASFDSLRIARLANPEAVRRAKCEGIWSPELRGPLYVNWKLLINHENLTVLDIDDPVLLHAVGVPPNLQELRISITVPRGGFWPALTVLQFPQSIRRLCIKSTRIEEGEQRLPDLSPNWLFSAFSGLEELNLIGLVWGADWSEVRKESLEKLTTVYNLKTGFGQCNLMQRCSLMTNLRFLRCEWFYELRGARLPCLEYLVIFNGLLTKYDSSLNARGLRFLFVEHQPFGALEAASFARFPDFFPRLQYLIVKDVKLKPTAVGAVLKRWPDLKHAEVSGSVRREHVDESSFPQVPGAALSCTWLGDSKEATYKLSFSCVTHGELQKAMAPLARELPWWSLTSA